LLKGDGVLHGKVGENRVGWFPLAPIVGLFLSAGTLLGQTATATAKNPSVTFSSPGNKQVTLQVCNAAGLCDTFTRTVVVLDPQPRILGMASVPTVVGTRQSIAFSAQTAGRPSLNHRWLLSGTAALALTGNPVMWNAQTPGVGTYQLQLEVKNSDGTALSTPVPVQVVRMTFGDVPPSFWGWKYVEALFTAGITNGCDSSPNFCPDGQATRAEVAASLVRATHGIGFVPPPATGVFSDVPLTHWGAPWIEQLYADGLTKGCNAEPLRYCPNDLVTRAEMGPFLLRARHGGSYEPPVPIALSFADVDPNFWALPWIEQLRVEGITNGCAVSPLRFCPSSPVTRAEMAGFIVKAFNLALP
jgi:hypothetical protein